MTHHHRLLIIAASLACFGLMASEARADAAALEKYPGAKEQIMSYYAANAREGSGNCGAGHMGAIGDAQVVSEDAGSVVLDVKYSYSATSLQGGGSCSGDAMRQFTLTKGGSGYTVTDMSGQGP